MIIDKIKKDVNDEFETLNKALQIHLKPDFDINQTKKFLETHVPKEVICKSEMLLDTLLNYLMEDAQKKIKGADVKLQNAFFDADFRKRVHEWAMQMENKLSLEPDIIKYTSDPRIKQGLIASGITFVIGAGVSSTLVTTLALSVVAGIVTILLAAFAFKIVYDKASPKARKIIKEDIEKYLAASKKQVIEWLEKVREAFEKDFNTFCSANGFLIEMGGTKCKI